MSDAMGNVLGLCTAGGFALGAFSMMALELVSGWRAGRQRIAALEAELGNLQACHQKLLDHARFISDTTDRAIHLAEEALAGWRGGLPAPPAPPLEPEVEHASPAGKDWRQSQDLAWEAAYRLAEHLEWFPGGYALFACAVDGREYAVEVRRIRKNSEDEAEREAV